MYQSKYNSQTLYSQLRANTYDRNKTEFIFNKLYFGLNDTGKNVIDQ